MHLGDTDLLLDVLLVPLLLAGTHSRDSAISRHLSWSGLVKMHYAVSDIVLQQEAHV